MADVIDRGVIEIVGDARQLRATLTEAKKSLASLGEGQKQATTAASRSIDKYIDRLNVQNKTIGKSRREAELYKLAFRGASQGQIDLANAALKFRDANEKNVASMRGFSVGFGVMGVGIGLAARELVSFTDEYTKFTAQLRLASSSQGEFEQSLAAVKNIATTAQASLGGIGQLYARIAQSTKQFGVDAKGVSDITETVALSLKVSGAAASESASAMLQLSQAFGSGVLRGEEFNAVNEAAPRLMRALADAIGVPVGALRQMAQQGEITAEALATLLPTALEDLRKEAQQVQTIGGAFTVLRNQVVEFVGASAESSGAITLISSAISGLANNLDVLAAALIAVTGIKLGQYLAGAAAAAQAKVGSILALVAAYKAESAAAVEAAAAEASKTKAAVAAAASDAARLTTILAEVAANKARAQSELAAAEAQIASTAAMGAQSAALAANTAAKAAHSAATARLAALETAQAAATVELTAAQAAQAVASKAAAAAQVAHAAAVTGTGAAAGIAARALGLLGGPIGWITTLLSLGAAAWSLWGGKAEEATNKAKSAAEQTADAIKSLREENEKLERRKILALTGPAGQQLAQSADPRAQLAADKLARIKQLQATPGGVGIGEAAQIKALATEYTALTTELERQKALKDDIQGAGQQRAASRWLKEYATDAEKAAEEIAKAKKELGSAFTPELERRIRAKFTKQTAKPFDDTREEARAQLQFDLQQIEAGASARQNALANAERIVDARRAADLLNDREYFAEKRKFIQENAAVEESALQEKIARLEREVATGKHADKDRLDNQRAIKEAEAELAKVRADATTALQVNAIESQAALDKIRKAYDEAKAAADNYLETVQRANARDIAGIGRGNVFREDQAALGGIDDKRLAERRRLEGELRRKEIDKTQFDAYLRVVEETYTKEVQLYKERTQKIREAEADWTTGAHEALANYLDDVRNVAKQTEQAVSGAIRGLEDVFVDLSSGGIKSFSDLKKAASDLGRSIVADINRILVRQNITGPLAEWLQGGGPGTQNPIQNVAAATRGQIGTMGEFLARFGVTPFNPAGDQSPIPGGPVAAPGGGGFLQSIFGFLGIGGGGRGITPGAGGIAKAGVDAAAGTGFAAQVATAGATFTTAATTAATELATAGATFAPEVTAAGASVAAELTASGASVAAEMAAAGASTVAELTAGGAAVTAELTAAGAAFAAEVIAAGTAFAATVAAGGAADKAGGAAGLAGGLLDLFGGSAEGGPITGPGTSTSDSVPRMLSAGEFVVRAASVREPGAKPFLHQLNKRGLATALDSIRRPAFSSSDAPVALPRSGAVVQAAPDPIQRRRVIPFARGGIIDRPRRFKTDDDRVDGLVGEAGPEAIMPLRPAGSGKLGVIVSGRPDIVLPVTRDGSGRMAVEFRDVDPIVHAERADRPRQAAQAAIVKPSRHIPPLLTVVAPARVSAASRTATPARRAAAAVAAMTLAGAAAASTVQPVPQVIIPASAAAMAPASITSTKNVQIGGQVINSGDRSFATIVHQAGAVRSAAAAPAAAAPAPMPFVGSFESGIAFVPRTGLAMLHQGERVVPKSQNVPQSGDKKIEINISMPPGTNQQTTNHMIAELRRELARNGSRSFS